VRPAYAYTRVLEYGDTLGIDNKQGFSVVRELVTSAGGAPGIGMGAPGEIPVTYARAMGMEKRFSGLTSVI